MPYPRPYETPVAAEPDKTRSAKSRDTEANSNVYWPRRPADQDPEDEPGSKSSEHHHHHRQQHQHHKGSAKSHRTKAKDDEEEKDAEEEA